MEDAYVESSLALSPDKALHWKGKEQCSLTKSKVLAGQLTLSTYGDA